MKAKSKKSTVKLARLINQHLVQREMGKAHYVRSDELLKQIVKLATLDAPVILDDEHEATVVDLFKEEHKVFRAHGISRYEVKVKKTPKCPEVDGTGTTIPDHEAKTKNTTHAA